MAYTPELTDTGSATLRRIAWSLGKPMTQTINAIFEYLPKFFDKNEVCRCCKDTTRRNTCKFETNERKISQ
jgi:recombinational DNA repair protein RecR